MKVLYFGSVEAPYQYSFWDECSKLIDVRCVYLFSQQSGHSWASYDSLHTSYLDYDQKKFVAIKKLLKLILKFKPKYIIIGGYKMPLSLLLIIVSRFIGSEVFLWMERPRHSNFYLSFIKAMHLRFVSLFVHRVLAIGSDAVNAYRNLNLPIYNFPYSIDTSIFPVKEKNFFNELRFVYLGQFIHRKGVLEAIKGFQLCKSSRIKLTLVGGGIQENEIKNLSQSDSRITILPYANYENIPAILNQHDVLIFPSRHDGYALTLVESMRAGLFIMGTSFTSSFNDYIVEKENGIRILVDANDIKSNIDWCLENIDLIKSNGPKNQSIIQNSVSNSRNSAQFLLKILKS